jgi:hypothetical protein
VSLNLWIDVDVELPELGPWIFDESAPREGVRHSKSVPVMLANGEEAWGHYFETTNDACRSIDGKGWSLEDNYSRQDKDQVTHWFELPTLEVAVHAAARS